MVVEALFFDLYGTLTVRVPDAPSGPGPGRVLIETVGDLGIDASTLNADTVQDELWQFAMLTRCVRSGSVAIVLIRTPTLCSSAWEVCSRWVW